MISDDTDFMVRVNNVEAAKATGGRINMQSKKSHINTQIEARFVFHGALRETLLFTCSSFTVVLQLFDVAAIDAMVVIIILLQSNGKLFC